MRAGVVGAVLVVASGVLAGCGGDPEAEAPIGAVVRSERMDALNLAIVTEDEEVGTLVGTFVNQAPEPDTLQGVAVETEQGPASAVLLDGAVALPSEEVVRLAPDHRVGLRGELPLGRFVEVTLAFDDSHTLSTLVPVEPPEGPYDDVEIPSADEVPES